MVLKRLERSRQTPAGWRLATVQEAKDNLESIKRENVLEEWDRVRLLDGGMGGSGYGFNVEEGFRSCLGYMLVVQLSDAEGDRKAVPYSELTELSKEARNAAVLLCCEDYNEEVLHWLVGCKTEGQDERKAASEVVSAIAREWQSLYAKSRSPSSSLEVSAGIQDSFKALLAHTQKSLTASKMKNENSEQEENIGYKIRDTMLSFLARYLEMSDLTRASELAGYLEMFREFGGEVVAETVWYVVVENMAWQTFSFLCSNLYEVVMFSELQFLIRNAYAVLRETQNELLEGFRAAAKEVKGDFKRFDEILREQWLPVFSCKGKLDVLSIRLLWAARKGDINVVKRLLESGVQPSATNNDWYEYLPQEPFECNSRTKLTPLHYAALNGDHRMCALLIHHNASLTAKDARGWTPLHYASVLMRNNDEVVRVLLSAGEDSIEGGAGLVDARSDRGQTPISLAVSDDVPVNKIAWMLSLSIQPESHFGELRDLSVYLRVSSRMGFADLVEKLVKDGEADPFEGDDEGKTSFHYAVEGEDEDVALKIIENLLVDKKQGSPNWEKISAGDKYGRNVLHVAAFLGRRRLCRKFLENNRHLRDSKDRDGQNAILYAVAGPHDNPNVLNVFINSEKEATNRVSDFSQTTPLHVAAARGNLDMVETLIQRIPAEERKNYVGAADVLGQTALHKAASGGHWIIVRTLLEEGAHPLKERDSDGKTALDYAAEAEAENAVKIAELLLNKCESDKQKSLLLFASAVGNGLPNSNSSLLEEYLKKEKSKIGESEALVPENSNPLRVAATLGDVEMTMECLSRGANMALFRDGEWRASLSKGEEKNVQDVLSKIKTIVDQGTDKPALDDNLGRSPFATGLAALFLNPFVKSPVTVGISGEWGMGKSSLMLQTEINLLKAAAQLAFKSSFHKNNLLGAGGSKLSVTGREKRRKIANALERLDAEKRGGTCFIEIIGMSLKRVKNFTWKFEEEEEPGSKNQTIREIPLEEYLLQGTTPSILTVQYNAWHYRNETEAWAGLAVEITKELEATMTVAHKLRTSWIYNWRNRKNSICFGVVLPFFLALMVAIWFSTIVWFVFDAGKHKDLKKLKYGGLPASMIVAAWGLGKSVISFVKPISSQVVDYICFPDHSQKLGYHQQVIDDITFLKENLYYKRSLKWEVFSFIWCCITWSWDENNVPGTKIRKMPPAFGNNLRMVVFVDDLDRCEENVILQIQSDKY